MVRYLTGLVVFLLMAASCGGSSSTPDPGATCLKNSDCKSPLTCSFGRCMEACAEVRDCPAGQQCVKNASGINTCLLPEVEKCNYTSQCATPLVCAADFACRNQCLTDVDCATSTQKCVLPDRVCAEPTAIDSTTGKLKNIPADGGAPAGGVDTSVADTRIPDTRIPDASVMDASVMDASVVDASVDSPLPVDTKPATVDAPTSGPEVPGVTDSSSLCTVEASALTLASSISANTTLMAGCVYKVTNNITIATSALLTVEPGVRVEFAQGAGLEVDGALNAVGNAALPIVFTGTQATAGYWDGIYFNTTIDNRNVLDHVIVEYAGYASLFSGVMANVGLYKSSVQITNSTLRSGGGFGLGMSAGSKLVAAAGFAGNTLTLNASGAATLLGDVVGQLSGGSTFSGNSKDMVAVAGHTVATAQSWPALDVPYLIGGTVTVQAALTIAAGAHFRFASAQGLTVSSTGSLTAQGLTGKEITFVADQPTPGYWDGISYSSSNDIKNVLDHVIIEYAGTNAAYSSSDPPSSLEIYKSRIQLTNTIARNGSGHGLTLIGATLDKFSGNQFTLNALGAVNTTANQVGQLTEGGGNTFTGNTADFIVVRGETVSTAQTWPTLDVPYQIASDMTFDADVALSAGAKLVFKPSVGLTISSTGSISAVGTAAAPIAFTCTQLAAGCWKGLYLYSSTSPLNVIDHATISYGGSSSYYSSSYPAADITLFGSKLTITNSTISYSSGYGIYWSTTGTSVVTQSGNTFTGNITADTP